MMSKETSFTKSEIILIEKEIFMPKRALPTKTTRSRLMLATALGEYQEQNTVGVDLEIALKAVRKATTKKFETELDMTPECANTYFQNRKKELVSSLAFIESNLDSASTEVALAASPAETPVVS
jgi:hypothetical protein